MLHICRIFYKCTGSEAWDPSLGAAAPIYFDHDSAQFALGKAEAHARYLERQKLTQLIVQSLKRFPPCQLLTLIGPADQNRT